MNTFNPEQDTHVPPVHFTPDEHGVVGRSIDPSSTEVTTPLEKIYDGFVDDQGRVVYPGINAPEQTSTANSQAELQAGRTVVPAVIDHTTFFDQLDRGGN